VALARQLASHLRHRESLALPGTCSNWDRGGAVLRLGRRQHLPLSRPPEGSRGQRAAVPHPPAGVLLLFEHWHS
jgi:hypothetical protein